MTSELTEHSQIFRDTLPDVYYVSFDQLWDAVCANLADQSQKARVAEMRAVAAEDLASKLAAENRLLQESNKARSHSIFGKSSEKSKLESIQLKQDDADEYAMDLGEVEDAQQLPPEILVQAQPLKRKPSDGRKPSARPEHIAVSDRTTLLGSANFKDCGGPLRQSGFETTTRISARIKYTLINEHYQRCTCRHCLKEHQPARPDLVHGCSFDPAFAADMVISKFVDGTPLERQHKALSGLGFGTTKSALCRAISRIGKDLMPLKGLLMHELRSSAVMCVDETRVPVYDKVRGAFTIGWGWASSNYGRNSDAPGRQVVVFEHTARRRTQNATDVIEFPPEVLLTDGAPIYSDTSSPGSKHALCNAHARRRFYLANEIAPSPDAQYIIELYQKIYRIEAELVGESAYVRKRRRQQHSRPLMDKLELKAQEIASRVESGSGLGKAAAYFIRFKKGLSEFLNDGDIEIDNNAVERAIRRIALVRKNSLFAGSE